MEQNKDKLVIRVVIVIAFCLFIQLVLSVKLWGTSRYFPLAPLFDFVPVKFSNLFELIYFILFLVSLWGMNTSRHKAWFTSFFLILMAIFIVIDLNRLQAWNFQFLLMLWPVCFMKMDKKGGDSVISLLRFVVIVTYFWSGFHKLNAHFLEETYSWMISGITWMSFFDKPAFAWSIPLAEMGIGLLLLFRKTRVAGVVMASMFHLVILLLLGPLGHDWNTIVWPWNAAMIVLVVLLFRRIDEEQKRSTINWNYLKTFIPGWPVLLIAGLLPVLHLVGRWDSTLSFSMYTGLADEAVFYFDHQDEECIPNKFKKLIFEDKEGYSYLSLDDWAMEELKVPAYASPFAYKQMAKQWCQCLKVPEESGLELLLINSRWETGTRVVKIPCTELLSPD